MFTLNSNNPFNHDIEYRPYKRFYYQFMDEENYMDKTLKQLKEEVRKEIDSEVGLIYRARSVFVPDRPIDSIGIPASFGISGPGIIQIQPKSNFLQQVEDFMRRYKLRDKYLFE